MRMLKLATVLMGVILASMSYAKLPCNEGKGEHDQLELDVKFMNSLDEKSMFVTIPDDVDVSNVKKFQLENAALLEGKIVRVRAGGHVEFCTVKDAGTLKPWYEEGSAKHFAPVSLSIAWRNASLRAIYQLTKTNFSEKIEDAALAMKSERDTVLDKGALRREQGKGATPEKKKAARANGIITQHSTSVADRMKALQASMGDGGSSASTVPSSEPARQDDGNDK